MNLMRGWVIPVVAVFAACGPGTSDQCADGEPGCKTSKSTRPVYYCTDIKPVLDAHCTGACHSATTTGSGVRRFRLDTYGGADGQLGAKDVADRIKARAGVSRTMPPAGGAITEDERALLAAWADQGSPECAATQE